MKVKILTVSRSTIGRESRPTIIKKIRMITSMVVVISDVCLFVCCVSDCTVI